MLKEMRGTPANGRPKHAARRNTPVIDWPDTLPTGIGADHVPATGNH